ncbi:glucose-1-phosphate thymidylyltransferase [Streptomyces arboris]|uniref:glucose-1-phosphate thymidylyltransferase n=1 Tax=Streptomyces arboris TaxID=2600619 RepID=UPI003C2F5751
MKALVLAGGMGTRLRPLTHSMPKQLVPLANKPVLCHALEDIAQAGVTDVGIIVGDWHKEIEEAVGDGGRFGLRITYLPQEAPFGLAHCVLVAREFLADDDFLMYLGDNVFADGVHALADAFRRDRPAAQVAVTAVDSPQEYGVAVTAPDGRVLGLQEKPREPRSDLAVTGAYFFTPEIHDAIARIRPSTRGEWEITDAIQALIDRGGEVRAVRLSDWWKDTGRVEDILDCNQLLLDHVTTSVRGSVDAASTVLGPVVVEPGARIIRSHLRGPLIIGAGCVIEDSYVGPYSAVGANCALTDAGISHSIMLQDATVTDVNGIHRSVIGRSARVGAPVNGTGRHRLVVGDHTELEVVA